MIPANDSRIELEGVALPWPRGTWQALLAEAITEPAELLAELRLDGLPATGATAEFPLRVPRGFVSRMRKGDPDDPLLRQVLPTDEELEEVPGFSRDPLGEAGAGPVPGVLHKYHGRVLLVVVGACPVHCRYCFRRHFPYESQHLGTGDWDAALAYIGGDESVEEVILSGGDPLSAPDAVLSSLVEALACIPHVRRLRVHSRMPIVLPQRVDEGLLDWLTGTRLTPVVVLHANHANEIDGEVWQAMSLLRSRGVTLLNQSVLLRGVNDSVEALQELSESLFRVGALPYYLHLLDRVQGAAHFEISESHARGLVWQLMQRLPGYLVPRLVRESPGVPAKVPVSLGPEAVPWAVPPAT